MDPRRLLPPLAVTMLLTLLLSGWVALREQPVPVQAERSGAAPAEGATLAPARQALADWDAARSRAWADGDVVGLRRLYTPGSRTARADASMLRGYVDRGLVVRDLRTQVLALRVLHESRSRLRLQVTDRVASGEVVDDDGVAVSRLPTDQASARVVTLRRGPSGGRWLVDEVRDVP